MSAQDSPSDKASSDASPTDAATPHQDGATLPHDDDDATPHQEGATLPHDDDAATPQQKAARAKAEAIVDRREHPTREVRELKRPRTVLTGCAMAWFGAVVLLWSAVGVLRIDENSPSIDEDWTASEVDTAVEIAHGLGVVFTTWALLITVFAIFAFLGKRWGATALLALAGIVTALSLYSLVTGFALEGLFTALWSISSATLVRARERSRDWYAALGEARRS